MHAKRINISKNVIFSINRVRLTIINARYLMTCTPKITKNLMFPMACKSIFIKNAQIINAQIYSISDGSKRKKLLKRYLEIYSIYLYNIIVISAIYNEKIKFFINNFFTVTPNDDSVKLLMTLWHQRVILWHRKVIKWIYFFGEIKCLMNNSNVVVCNYYPKTDNM